MNAETIINSIMATSIIIKAVFVFDWIPSSDLMAYLVSIWEYWSKHSFTKAKSSSKVCLIAEMSDLKLPRLINTGIKVIRFVKITM